MATTLDDAASGSTTVLPVDDVHSNAQATVPDRTTTDETASATTIASAEATTSADAPTTAVIEEYQYSTVRTTANAESSETTSEGAAPVTDAQSDAPVLDHVFVGLDGSPINGLKYRFESDGAIIDGATDSDGNAASVKSFSAGSDCTVSVLTDSGDYKQVACYTVPTTDTSATLTSGSMVLESETQQHGGSFDDVAREPSTPLDDADGTQTHPSYSSEDSSTTENTASDTSSASDGSASQDTGPVVVSATTNAQGEDPAPVKSPVPKPKTASTAPSAANSQAAEPPKPKGGAGGRTPSKATTAARDSLGHPQAAPAETFTDWAAHKVHVAWHYIEDLFGFETNPVAGKAVPAKTESVAKEGGNSTNSATQDLAALQSLVTIAEEQTEHSMPSPATVVNLKRIADGSIVYGSKPSRKSKGQCYMYVKVALWRANTIKFIKNKKGNFDAAGGSYAKVAGEFLMSQGFVNVTDQLPDARWALPGDVIVYHVKGDTETADGRGHPGHIDIRTYHYYVSDFKRNYLCFSGGGGKHFYEVSGIYRKPGFFDPLALVRMKAFLKIIRSREAKAFFSLGDDKTYFASQGVYKIQDGIKDFSTYPPNPKKKEDHQGAYQIARSSWTRGHAPDIGALPSDFSPQTQDRYAVWLMEGEPGRFGPKPNYPPVPSALGFVRQGEIDQAVSLLHKRQWPSLPGGGQDQGYTAEEMKADFSKYLKEYSGS
ncbi:flagellar hook-length control protein FliK [Burkholderia ubonensis]|uniref:hypothetical protein n=1 Tax=Burkholderia ubonensis TaxID=101571 RepID=UPI00075D2D14|nr:hypothetical protein [Burkholderia ubonensis]KWA73113.1 flagellar hook-length control protein FliK [Burkholderia ubonensis]KWN57452.1 flagellar hook-length control protein FliK [Burkholderia ubonensis]